MTSPTSDQSQSIAKVSKQLLIYALENPTKSDWLTSVAIKGICRAAAADDQAIQLLRSSIGTDQIPVLRIRNLRTIARELEFVTETNPSFVSEVYENAFTHVVNSEEETSLFSSPILPLTSNLRQDYQGATRNLAENFKSFLAKAPANAVATMCQVLNIYVTRKLSTDRANNVVFEINSQTVQFMADGSCFWDSNETYKHDAPVMMLDSFCSFIEMLAKSNGDFSPVLTTLAENSPPPVVWSRVLRIASSHPSTLGIQVVSLLLSPRILVEPDTRFAASDCLRTVFPLLDTKQKEAIEISILSIPNDDSFSAITNREEKRNRLLMCLDVNHIVLEETQLAVGEVQQNPPEEEQPFTFEVGRGPSFEEIERIRADRSGSPDSEPESHRINELMLPVRQFYQDHLNGAPSDEQVRQAIPILDNLIEAIESIEDGEIASDEIGKALGAVAAAYNVVLRNTTSARDPEIVGKAAAAFILASQSTKPASTAERNDQFENGLGIGHGLGRSEAAEGLIRIASLPDGTTPEVKAAIRSLSKDPANVVRYRQIDRLINLCEYENQFMWEIAEQIGNSETSYAVAASFIYKFLHKMMLDRTDLVLELAKKLFERMPYQEDQRRVTDAYMNLLFDGYIHLGLESAKSRLEELVHDVNQFPNECHALVNGIRELISVHQVDAAGADPVARERAWVLLQSILKEVMQEWMELNAAYGDRRVEEVPEEIVKLWQSLGETLQSASQELYFASGAYDERKFVHGRVDAREPSQNSKIQFWQEVQPALDLLEPAGLAPAVHNLIEMLKEYIEIDPTKVFQRIGNIIVLSAPGGYPLDSLAVDLVVKIVERYLAEYRHILREDAQCRESIIKVLDIFVDWPKARQLAYRLEEIYR